MLLRCCLPLSLSLALGGSSPGSFWTVKRKQLGRECLAELIGTFILIVFGLSANAQLLIGGGQYGTDLSNRFAWGLAVTFGIYAAGGVSGAHLNPAVTFAVAIHRGFRWHKVPFFIIAQCLGALLGCVVVWGVHYDGIYWLEAQQPHATGELTLKTAGIFATFPQDYTSVRGQILDQLVCTALLLFCIVAVNDQQNFLPVAGNLAPLMIGFSVLAIGCCWGLQGNGMNPARDFIPRVFTSMAGWGSAPFTAHNNWWWIPLVIPMIGGPLGVAIYDFFISLHHAQPMSYEELTGEKQRREKKRLRKQMLKQKSGTLSDSLLSTNSQIGDDSIAPDIRDTSVSLSTPYPDLPNLPEEVIAATKQVSGTVAAHPQFTLKPETIKSIRGPKHKHSSSDQGNSHSSSSSTQPPHDEVLIALQTLPK